MFLSTVNATPHYPDYTVTFHINSVSKTYTPSSIELKAKPFWRPNFEYCGKYEDNVSMIVAAVYKHTHKLPTCTKNYHQGDSYQIDSFIDTQDIPKEILDIFEKAKSVSNAEVGKLYHKAMQEFITSLPYKNLKAQIQGVLGNKCNIKLFKLMEDPETWLNCRTEFRLCISGLPKVLEDIGWNDESQEAYLNSLTEFILWGNQKINGFNDIETHIGTLSHGKNSRNL